MLGEVYGQSNAPDNYGDTGNIHTNPDCPCYMLDKQSGILKSGDWKGDIGSASRFFYVAKASRKERNMGLEGIYTLKENTPPKIIEEIKKALDVS